MEKSLRKVGTPESSRSFLKEPFTRARYVLRIWFAANQAPTSVFQGFEKPTRHSKAIQGPRLFLQLLWFWPGHKRFNQLTQLELSSGDIWRPNQQNQSTGEPVQTSERQRFATQGLAVSNFTEPRGGEWCAVWHLPGQHEVSRRY